MNSESWLRAGNLGNDLCEADLTETSIIAPRLVCQFTYIGKFILIDVFNDQFPGQVPSEEGNADELTMKLYLGIGNNRSAVVTTTVGWGSLRDISFFFFFWPFC